MLADRKITITELSNRRLPKCRKHRSELQMPDPVRFQPELIHPSIYLAPGAVVIGDVTIGEDSSIWFNAVLRGDTAAIRIGQRTNIQDCSVLHADEGFPCTVGDGVTVGHGAIVHGAIVENNVMIGMRAVVMNGARVGENSLVAVGAVVLEGMIIPPGSLVMGMPARIKGELSPDHIARIRAAADHYVNNARRYRQG